MSVKYEKCPICKRDFSGCSHGTGDIERVLTQRKVDKNIRDILKKELDKQKPYLAKVQDMQDGPFTNGQTIIVLGEIEQMPRHVVVATKDGQVYFGWHSCNFRKLTKDEA